MENEDYLVVLPTNPPDVVRRVGSRFNLSLDDVINISGTNKEFLVSLRSRKPVYTC
jgi:hypothetical protein